MIAKRLMKKTITKLADGRELIYFDESDESVREVIDSRELPATSITSEIRYDALLDEWVAIASHRQGRTHLPPSDACPLCPSSAVRATEIPAGDYDVVVFENRFPSLAESVPGVSPAVGGETLFRRQRGVGRCEVVCFSDDHDVSFADLSPKRVRTVVDALADRTRAMSMIPGVEQVFPFENRGTEIGVTLSHPHGQIYAYPFVTPRTRRMLDSARRFRERNWRNLFEEVLQAEQRDGSRIVRQTDHWTAFVPAAARWPVEVHLYPNRRVLDLPELTDAERDDFAGLYLDILRRVDALYGVRMPYIAGWNQAPVRIDRDLAYLHLQLLSTRRAANKLKYLAGSESGMGVFINDVVPEHAAQMLREAGT